MKRTLFLLLPLFLFLFSFSLFAQNPSRVTIKGVVADTTGERTAFATVMLLNPKDSTLINFTRSGEKGDFDFKNVKNVPYLLKVSYVGHLPLQRYLPASATDVNDVGVISIKPITSELLEVVVKAAKSTLSIKGDTIEYDASSFKVPPGSTVEDLLRRLPGIEVDADGNIRAQGRDVKRVYVDGKTFFGDDPKAATKNLGAETISKVQVYNESSEQAKLTGVDDGKKEKAMNLELKDEYKKGSFGKLTAAIGTEERWAGRGSYNRFNTKEQLSFIGFANNINQSGVNWEDYGEFKGQNTFGDQDNGDFGFGSGQRYYTIGGTDDSPFNNFDGRGFTTNYGGGVNYNYDHKKVKFNASYFYKEVNLDLDQFTNRQTFLPDTTFFSSDTLGKTDFRGNHSIASRLTFDIDSSDMIVLKVEGRLSNSNAQTLQQQYFSDAFQTRTNALSLDNSNDLASWRITSTAIYRHRFEKKGRSFAISAGYNDGDSDANENLFSRNQALLTGSLTQIRQFNSNTSNTRQLKSSALYTEPLSKTWFWETFANASQTNNEVNRPTGDPENNNQRIDSLSVYYEQQVQYARIGTSLRYSKNGLNLSYGLAGQHIGLSGEYSVAKGLPPLADPLRQKYFNVTPNVDATYQFPNDIWLSLNYNYKVTEPQFNDLQPVPIVTNPAYRTLGNPDLQPQRSHNVGGNINYWNSGSMASVGIGADYDIYDYQIVYSQIVEFVDSTGVRTTTRPENVSGGQSVNTYVWSNIPIIKTKLTVNINPHMYINRSPSFINGVENETFNQNYNLRIGFNITPSSKFIGGISGNARINNIEYSVQSEQNQKIRSYGSDFSVKWQFANKTFLESNFNYNVFRNDRFDFDQSTAIWNASVRRLVGKSNRFELRLAAFDLLNQRLNIQQSGTQNYVLSSIAPTLARYFMLSVSYNVRGYEDKLKKNDWW
ncbi:MAG: outer membrane beta-barrel protein [Saprospiraceae bacterium]|nr:outer membrane beta-barrel protein [Saprospiraceae bacterium]